MLIEFTTKNFRSFKDEATLSMVAETLKNNSEETHKLENGISLLPVAGIFGPNSSGKSNILRALFLMKYLIEHTDYLNVPVFAHPLLQPFLLDEKSSNQPSYFQMVLWDNSTKSEYRYGFELTRKEIISEWLIESSKVSKNISSKELFTREKQVVKFHKSMKKATKELLVHPNGLALNMFAQFTDPIASKVYDLIRHKLWLSEGTFDLGALMQVAFQMCYENPHFIDRIHQFLIDADLTTIDKITLNREPVDKAKLQKLIPAGFIDAMGAQELFDDKVLTSHKVHGSQGKNISFTMREHESIGTQRLFGMGAIILQVLDLGGALAMDEFGSSLHPFISSAIIKVFKSKKLNPNNAQLIFSSHDTFLLSSKGPGLRRDEIWFTEKDKMERTTLHSLAEYKTKKDLEIAKNYLEGRFGAVPVTTFEA